MQEIGAFEAKNTLGALLDRVERGEEIVITRHGRPAARLVPSTGAIDREKTRAAAQRILSRAKKVEGGFDWDNLKQDSDQAVREPLYSIARSRLLGFTAMRGPKRFLTSSIWSAKRVPGFRHSGGWKLPIFWKWVSGEAAPMPRFGMLRWGI